MGRLSRFGDLDTRGLSVVCRCRCDASIVWLHDRTKAVRISRADVSSRLCVPDGALDLVTLAAAS